MQTITSQNSEKNRKQPAQTAAADACKLLAACFYPPDGAMLFREGVTEKLSAVMKTASPAAAPLVPRLPADTGDASGNRLSAAYTRLFLGPPEMLAPPYASFYLDKGRSVMGPSAVEIERIYKTTGLGIDEDFNEMPDHIAVMLEFLYYLLFREAVAGAIGNDSEKQEMQNIRDFFTQNFVHPWIPEFCRNIVSADRHPFYTGLGRCLDIFIHSRLDKEGRENRYESVFSGDCRPC